MTDITALAQRIPERKRHDWSQSVMRDCDFCNQWALTVKHEDGARICASCCDAEYTSKLEVANTALVEALEKAQKSNEFLKDQLSELANFNPDWDKLEASYESWREIAAELLVAKERIAELENAATEPVAYCMEMDGRLYLDPASTCKGVVDSWVEEWSEMGAKTVPLYATPQIAPVMVPDGLRMALSNAGIAAPESDEMLSAKAEEFIQDLVTWVKDRKPFQSAPVVPEASQQNSDGVAGMAEHYETTISMLKGRIAELESEVKFPGVMRCNTCNFSRSYVVVTLGGVRAGESVPESCPNGCGPLWHDTYRRQYNELYDAYKELESRTVTSVTYSESADADSCRKWAWEQVKGEVSTEGWTTGDNINYFGFFFWGWDMRRQYNEQRTVTVKLPERYDITGDEDGNCCFNDASMQKDPCGSFLLARDVLAMLGTAGIQVIEGEGQ